MTTKTKATKTEKNPLVVIELDRPRFVRFGHKALKQLTALTGTKLEKMDENEFELDDLEKIMWCGLQADAKENNEPLKLEDMEDLLDQADSIGAVMTAMSDALAQAFDRTEKEKN